MPIFNLELWHSESEYQLWLLGVSIFAAVFYFAYWLISKHFGKVGRLSHSSLPTLMFLSFAYLQAARVLPPGWQPWTGSISTALGTGLLLLTLWQGMRALRASSRRVKEAALLVASFPVMFLVILILPAIPHWPRDWNFCLLVLGVYAMFAVPFRVFAHWRKQDLDEQDDLGRTLNCQDRNSKT